MARLSSISELHPVTVTAQKDKTAIETKFLQCKPTRQAVSTVVGRGNNPISYRKQFSGSVLLSMQFRMHPSIAAFSSAIFYDGLLGSPLTLSNQRQFPLRLHSYYPVSNKGSSVRFVNVGGRTNEQRGELDDTGELVSAGATSDPSNSSYRNEEEAGEVLELLKTLLNRDENEAFQGSIGIVTPYSSQVALIKSMIAQDEEIREMAQTFPYEIEVKSVE
jgi:superfamily I DNA and/or RNA helicase